MFKIQHLSTLMHQIYIHKFLIKSPLKIFLTIASILMSRFNRTHKFIQFKMQLVMVIVFIEQFHFYQIMMKNNIKIIKKLLHHISIYIAINIQKSVMLIKFYKILDKINFVLNILLYKQLHKLQVKVYISICIRLKSIGYQPLFLVFLNNKVTLIS